MPGAAVIAVALRAAAAEEARTRDEEAARRSEVARAVRAEVEATVVQAKASVGEAGDEDAALEKRRPLLADVAVLDASGKLRVSEAAGDAAADDAACPRAKDDLLGPNRGEARRIVLERCPELRGTDGRHVWPLVATEDDVALTPALSAWLAAHRGTIAERDRTLLARRLHARAPSPERDAALRELDRAQSSLQESLAPSVDDVVDRAGPVVVRRGRAISVLRARQDGTRAGYVVHGGSIAGRAALPGDLQLEPGPATEAGDATVAVTPKLALHVAPRDRGASSRAARRAGVRIVAIAAGCVVLSVGLAALLFARARRAQRLAELRTDFVAAVSHELRTPLATVRMLAELLERGDVAPEERAEVETTLAGETRRLATTLERMLRFGSLARGKLVADPKPTDVGDLVRKAAERPGRDVVVEVEEGLVADLDEGLMSLALDNLLSNAAKYAPEGGPHRVRARRVGPDVELSVTDRGPGLDRRAQRRIFHPFERADDRLSRATEGTGVGLAIVRGIARAHGGDAFVESAPGAGATFTIRIPREKRS